MENDNVVLEGKTGERAREMQRRSTRREREKEVLLSMEQPTRNTKHDIRRTESEYFPTQEEQERFDRNLSRELAESGRLTW